MPMSEMGLGPAQQGKKTVSSVIVNRTEQVNQGRGKRSSGAVRLLEELGEVLTFSAIRSNEVHDDCLYLTWIDESMEA